jgi:hypothetical protein
MASLHIVAVILLVTLAGCVPATTPAQLAHTPEAPVTISDGVVDNGLFRARYPDGWEVVTGMDGVMVFSAPDGLTWAMLSADEAVSTPTPVEGTLRALYSQGVMSLGGESVTVTMLAQFPEDQVLATQPIFDAIAASIELVSTEEPS